MTNFSIERFDSPLMPWQVFRQIYAHHKHCFFLDSHAYLPPNQAFSYIGFSPRARITLQDNLLKVTGERETVHAPAEWKDVFRSVIKPYLSQNKSKHPFLTGGLVGYFGYEMLRLMEPIILRNKKSLNLPLLDFGLYTDLIVFDHEKGHYWLMSTDLFSKQETAIRIEKLKKYFSGDAPSSLQGFYLKNFKPDLSRIQFEEMVKKAKQYIESGDIYQANLSQRFSFDYEGSVLQLYESLRGINPSPFASFFKINDLHILSSSPERLIRKKGDHCETIPIAGTRPRSGKTQEDLAFEAELLENKKENAEHIMLVDLERNDLGKVCEWSSVTVKDLLKIEKYSHVMHLVSSITGKLKKNQDALDLVSAMFPGGTITGCPKVRCMQIIDELEPTQRELYTGSIGYFDFYGDLDLNIIIRTLVLSEKQGSLQVGAGIVHDSDPRSEYLETLHKGEALTEALVKAACTPC